ncbi:hypothetical protein ACHAWU_000917 [Discostella pseudostelligera]|uniref:Uncharacterized protein n=1 Tax=Discostella pseudostelligera TaxID=259834 RepID=A0ABD3MP31_9STRA
MSDTTTQTRLRRRRLCYAIASSALGAWAFYKVNSISGPAFEPILKACTDPTISLADFAKKTGYHVYEPKVGLGIFKVFVCLITQFLLGLRETPTPAGLLTWWGVVLVSLPLNVAMTVGAGRRGAIGPVRYPTILGLLSQILGVSVIIPLVYVPSYIYSRTEMGVPVSNFRILCGACFALPIVGLSAVIFSSSTTSYLWTISAGILGGPILAMMSLSLWFDKSSCIDANPSNIAKSARGIRWAYSLMEMISFVIWLGLVGVMHQTHGLFSVADIWRDIWVEASPFVAFMTVDTGVLYLGALLFIAYHDEWKTVTAICLTPFVGPGAACCRALAELEDEAATAYTRNVVGKKE